MNSLTDLQKFLAAQEKKKAADTSAPAATVTPPPEEHKSAEAPAQSDFSDAVDERLALSGALRGLQRRERVILHLRFVEGLTQTEIANQVGLSQMYVSRLLRSSLERLRDGLGLETAEEE